MISVQIFFHILPAKKKTPVHLEKQVCQCFESVSINEMLIWKISWCAFAPNKFVLVWKSVKTMWQKKIIKETKKIRVVTIYIMWHRGLTEQLSLLCDSFVSDKLLVRNFMTRKDDLRTRVSGSDVQTRLTTNRYNSVMTVVDIQGEIG